MAVRLCLIPDPAPPYDAGKEQPVVAGERPDQGRAPGPRAAVSREHTGQPDDALEHGGPQGGGQAAGTAPESPAWPSRFAQVLAETLAGSRPPYQMVPWTTEMARAHIGRLGPQLASSQQPRVRRVVTFHPTRDAIEMTVVAAFGPRVHALAVRMERDTTHACHPPRWLCTAIEAA